MAENEYDNGDRLEVNAASFMASFGLSGQESAVYIALLGDGEMNGYEVAKQLSISRSNAYTALAALVDKGAAWVIEGASVRYTPVPPGEFCANRLRQMSLARDALLAALPSKKASPGSYITITGRERILDRLRNLIADAGERVYLAAGGSVIAGLSGELIALLAAGKKLVVITDAPDAARLPVGAAVHVAPLEGGQLRAIADSRYVMTGDLGLEGREATCLFSDHPNLVSLFKTALRNEIILADLEAREPGIVSGNPEVANRPGKGE